MVDQTYLVTLKPPSRAIKHVVASIVGFRGDHLVFVDAKGTLAALFLLDLVESWEYCRVWTDGLSGGFGRSRSSSGYHGSRQRIVHAVNDKLGIEPFGGPG
jgi:hypothetical protein